MRRRLRGLTRWSVLGWLVPMIGSAQPDAAPVIKLLQLRRPLVIAHRGYSAVAPENTLPAFQLALASGADLVELDIHQSRDGVPVVLHDFTLDRTTDATNRWGGQNLAVKDYTIAELKTLDAGGWFDTRYAGTRLPTLTEALEVIQSEGGVTVIERKAGDAATLARLLRSRGLINHVVVQSFDWRFLREFHSLEPEQVLGALGPPALLANGRQPDRKEKQLDDVWLDELAKTGARLVVWDQQLTRQAIGEAHKRGLKVWVYTIDDPAKANALLDMGVNGLITNHPARMWRTFALRYFGDTAAGQ